MTRSQKIVVASIIIFVGGLQALVELDLKRRQVVPEDPVIVQVKHEYTISCTAGQTIQHELYTCEDLKRFINKYEGHKHVKNIRSGMVSSTAR